MRAKAVARRLQPGSEEETLLGPGNHNENAAADSQESGSPPPSPASGASDPPTLVHIKQESMPPGGDIKDYYGGLDFGLPEAYLSNSYSHHYTQRFLDKTDEFLKDDAHEPDAKLPKELQFKRGGLFARETIPCSTKYGPFTGKWESQPADRRYAWEILGKNGNRSWLDGTNEQSNWLKLIRSTNYPDDFNVQHSVIAGQVWYRTIREIPPGEELLLGPKTPLPLQDVFTEEEEREETEPRCSFCDAPFPNIDALDRHQIQVHSQPAAAFHCELCNRAYSSRTLLLRHRALAHTDIRKYPCENCPKRHIRAQHHGARSHACPECGKTFSTSSGLKQHTHIHSSVKPFQCKVCFKAYTQFSNLCRHKRMHVACQGFVECGKCGQSFKSYALLTKHKRFCDTATAANVSLRGQMPQGLPQLPALSNVGMNNPNNPNPFPMYRPTLPIPYNTFAHYPALFSAAAAACPPEFLNPLLFNVQGRLAMEHDLAMSNANLLSKHRQISCEGRITVGLDSSKSTDSSNSFDDMKKKEEFDGKRDENDRITPKSQTMTARQSPLSVDEVSQPRPSPVMPMPTPIIPYNFNRDDTKRKSPFNFSLKLNNNDVHNNKPSISPALTKDSAKSVGDRNSEYSDNDEDLKKDQGDQPLDLSVSRKQSDKESDVDNDDRSFRNSPSDSPVDRDSKTPENDATDIDVEGVEPKREDSPPQLVSPALAFPMPVHPQHNNLMDLYRQRYPPFRSASDAILNSSHSPYVPSPFNFLSPLLGTDGPDRQPAAYAKFRELSAGTGKLRDRYACKFCGKTFPRSANLTRHLRTHTGEQPYKCKYCERSFSISSNLQRHVRNIHNKERPFRCPLCDRCFGQQTNLDRHLKKHEAEGGDSPSSVDTERDDFDDIRSFMRKVTCSPGAGTPPVTSPHAPQHPQPPHRPSALAIST